MRVLVTGGRYYADTARIWRVLDQIDAERGPIRVVIEGASDDVTGPYIGADYWSHQWALAHNRGTVRCHAEWKTQGKAAGPIRNQRMLDEHHPDAVVEFPGHVGTANMVALARKAGVEVITSGHR